MAIKNIIFDLDNTLVNADVAYEVALKSIGLSAGKNKFKNARREVKARLPKGHVAARNRLLYFKRILEERREFSSVELLRMMAAYERALFVELKAQTEQLKRSALFAKLKKKNLNLAILTNENLRTQLVKLNAIDPDGKYFSSLLTSEEIGFEKPDRRAYLEALRMNRFKLNETLMVGDDIEADVNGGKAVGLTTVFVYEFLKAPTQMPKNADYSVRFLDEILDLL